MKRSTKITLCCVALMVAGWAFLANRREYYRNVEIESTEWQGETLRIVFSTPPETLYWCPGADVKAEPDAIHIGFVRAGYKQRMTVAAPAEYSPLLRKYYIEIENQFQKPVYMLPENDSVWTEAMEKSLPK